MGKYLFIIYLFHSFKPFLLFTNKVTPRHLTKGKCNNKNHKKSLNIKIQDENQLKGGESSIKSDCKPTSVDLS